MSRKNVKKASLPHDQYYTPEWVVRQCCEVVLPLAQPSTDRILEPSAGHGVFVEALRQQYPRATIHANDIDAINHQPQRMRYQGADHTYAVNFLDFQPPDPQPYGLCVGNPPYSLALRFIEHALTMSECVVFLLRQGFLSSAKRNPFFRASPPIHVFQLAHRPSFTNDRQTDFADYCFVVWDRRRNPRVTKLHWLPTVAEALRKR